jgi:hypothetical protein
MYWLLTCPGGIAAPRRDVPQNHGKLAAQRSIDLRGYCLLVGNEEGTDGL